MMHQAFDVHSLRHARFAKQIDGTAFQNSRADAPQHILRRLTLKNDRVDAGVVQVLSDLGGPGGLKGLDAPRFAQRMARLYGDLDYLHPFKEGNSRTLRAFTRQLASTAGYALDWNTTNADAASRDRLYIARDKEVLKRAFPGLDQERAMKTEHRAEYEAYVRFVAPFNQADTLQMLIEASVRPLNPPSK